MSGNKSKAIGLLSSVLIMTGIMILMISAAAYITEKGIIDEEMMSPIICAAILTAGLVGSIIINKRTSSGKIIRGFIIGLVLFGIPYLIGKSTSAEPIETGKAAAFLLFSLIGSICGAVITNKKRSYRRR